jgi:rubrerythrin
MEMPQMVRMALSELIQAAVMAEPAAVMVYRGLWRRGHGKEAKHVRVRVGVSVLGYGHVWTDVIRQC